MHRFDGRGRGSGGRRPRRVHGHLRDRPLRPGHAGAHGLRGRRRARPARVGPDRRDPASKNTPPEDAIGKGTHSAMNEVLVSIELGGTTQRVGTLWTRERRGRQSRPRRRRKAQHRQVPLCHRPVVRGLVGGRGPVPRPARGHRGAALDHADRGRQAGSASGTIRPPRRSARPVSLGHEHAERRGPGDSVLPGDRGRAAPVGSRARRRHALYRRIIFNVLTSNTDGHLRNHGFLFQEPGRWPAKWAMRSHDGGRHGHRASRDRTHGLRLRARGSWDRDSSQWA